MTGRRPRWGALAAAVLAFLPLRTPAAAEDALDMVGRAEAGLAADDSRPERWRGVLTALMFRDGPGDRARVAEVARLGLERLPDSAEMIALHARARLHLGDLGLAAEEARRAIAADPTAAEAWRVLGEVHLLEWRLDDARDALERAAGLAPSDPDPFRLLARLYERTKQYPLAADHWEVIESRIRRDGDPAPEGEWVPTGRTALLRAMGARTPFAVEGRPVSTSVPMRRSRDGMWLVQARVNGGPEEWFDVDTGSEAVLISIPLMRKLNVAVISTSAVTGIGGRPAAGRTVILDALRVGDLTVRNVPAEVLDRLPGQRRSSAGSLGQAFLREFVVTMDFPGQTFSLALPRRVRDADPEPEEERERKIKYAIPMRYPTVTEGYWEGSERIPILWDTGAGLSVVDARLVHSASAPPAMEARERKGRDGTGEIIAYRRVESPAEFRIGDLAVSVQPAVLDLREVNRRAPYLGAILGADAMRDLAVTFDYFRGEIRVRKAVPPPVVGR